MSTELREVTFDVSEPDEKRLNKVKAEQYEGVSEEEMLRSLLLHGLKIAEERQRRMNRDA